MKCTRCERLLPVKHFYLTCLLVNLLIQIPFLRIGHLISFQMSMEGTLSGVRGLTAR